MKINNNLVMVNFTKNEKEIIRLLLDNGRITDMEMAAKLRISAQAVGKIRKKLEENEIIEGYSCNLNFEKMGVNMFCVCLMKLKSKFFKNVENHNAIELLRNIPDTIFTCMPSSSRISVISVHGFRNAKEMERYYYTVEATLYDFLEIIEIYSFSPHNLVKNNSNQLFQTILDDKPITPITFPK